MEKDYCTWFPEYWYTWKFKRIYIGNFCKEHDNEPKEGKEFSGCRNTSFYKKTWEARLIGAVAIATIASIACFVFYPKEQTERI